MDNNYKQTSIKDNDFSSSINDIANIFKIYKDSDGNYYYNMLKNLNIKNLNNIPVGYYDLYLVQNGDNYNMISYKKYGTIEYWWLICKFNNIINPLEFPTEGIYLKLPTVEVITMIKNMVNI